MDKKRIGIYYNTSDSWIGGKYYLDGIINVLKQNPQNEIVYLKLSFFSKVIGRLFGKKSKIYKMLYKQKSKKLRLDVVFPFYDNYYSGKKNMCWIPDFQENYYPDFFSIEEICSRLSTQAKIAYSNNYLILSSESAKMDFERLYPKHSCTVYVLPFVSNLYGKGIEYDFDVLKKYNINEKFFICSNQLWKHKNHIAIINAVKALKQQGKHVLCLFTGKEEDFRDSEYPGQLKGLVKEYGLESEIRFLGFIPRNDQIELMRQSIAVIQPSLFEGWNTTIEDAKVFNKLVIASSLPVHKEQLGNKGIYFDVNDYNGLAKILDDSSNNQLKSVCYDYEQAVNKYVQNINVFIG